MGVQRNGGISESDETPRTAARLTAVEPTLAQALDRAEHAERRVRELEVELARVRSGAPTLDSERPEASDSERAALLEAVFDAMTDGVIVYDRHGHMVRTNPANREILGNEAAWKDYFARPIEERLELLRLRDESGEPLPVDDWPHLRVLRGETLANQTAMRVLARDLHGRDKHLIITGAPLRDEDGRIIGAVCIHRDVTERRRLRAEAIQRASLLEAIFEAVPDRISLFDAHGRITRTNSSAQRSIGAARGGERLDEFQSAYTLRTLSGEPYPMEELPVTRSLRGETVTGVEMLFRSPDGRDEVILTNSAPVTDPEGTILGVVSITHDITALRTAEQAAELAARQLSERALRLETIIDAVADPLVVYDAHGNLEEANQAFRDLLRRLRADEDYIDQAVDERFLPLLPRALDGTPLPKERWPVSQMLRGEVLSGPTIVDMLLGVGERQVILSSSGAPIRDAEGQIIGAVAVHRDVTNQRQLAKRTRASLDALLQVARTLVQPATEPAPTGAEQPAGRSDSLAHQLATLTCTLLGCTRVSLSVVEPGTGLVRPLTVVGMPDEDTRRWFQEQEAHPARLGESADPELMRRFLAGEVIALDLTKPPYDTLPNPYHITTVLTVAMRVGEQVVGTLALDHSGAPHTFTEDEIQLTQAIAQLAALSVERDRLIRERADAEAQVLALEETNRRMSEFLSIASHELRTPLTSAIANSQLARREIERLHSNGADGGQSTARRLEWLVSRTEQQLQRQSRLVTDLLDVSRIEVGRLEMELSLHDLLALARECVEEQRLAHPRRVISLSAPRSRERIDAVIDADRIGQALTNYLTNALKYSSSDTPVRVRVSIRGDMARVEVRDHGPGLPPEERQRIWQRFHRAPGIEVLTGSGVGLGIGLYITRTIIERHGGSVGVESITGEGSTFWFEIPCLIKPVTGGDQSSETEDVVADGGA